MSNLCVLKLSEMATLPTKGSDFAAAFDLYSAHNASIPPFSNALIQTDLSPSFPDGCYGRIAGRSGLALYSKIIVGGGVVDPDFRGNISIVLFNLGKEPYEIHRGDRIAQMICENFTQTKVCEVKCLSDTKRGDRGFGSSNY